MEFQFGGRYPWHVARVYIEPLWRRFDGADGQLNQWSREGALKQIQIPRIESTLNLSTE